jgi:hypothetical protein
VTAQITRKLRFDDIAPANEDGVDYCYQGYNYELLIGGTSFIVRTYDDELGRAIVMEPLDALARSEARVLVDFLCSELSCSRIEFYSLDKGHYRVVDAGSLKFISSD